MAPRSRTVRNGVLGGLILGRAGPAGLLVFVIVLALFVALGGVVFFVMVLHDRDAEAGSRSTARVVRVIDGDTIVVKVPGHSDPERVRLLGVDAPEVAHGTTSADCWGPRSRTALRKLLPAGMEVGLRDDSSQPSRDDYGRLLRYVDAGQMRDVGAEMIRRGDARAGVGDFDVARLDDYKRVESVASDADTGLWRTCRFRF